jgi:hypothetical protein
VVERIRLTPHQAGALRAMRACHFEQSLPEVAVAARLIPSEARATLGALERMALVSASAPSPGGNDDRTYELTDKGRVVANALNKVQGGLAVGALVRVPSALPRFLGWLSHGDHPTVEIVPEEQPA